MIIRLVRTEIIRGELVVRRLSAEETRNLPSAPFPITDIAGAQEGDNLRQWFQERLVDENDGSPSDDSWTIVGWVPLIRPFPTPKQEKTDV